MQLNKLNQEWYDLTFGQKNVPPIAQNMSKHQMHLNYKKYNQRLWDTGDTALQNLRAEEQCPTVAETLAIPIYEYINIIANDCGYSGTAEEIIVNYVHTLFLKANSAETREENNNWCEATTGTFAGEYWKEMKNEIATLEFMGVWDIFKQDENMNSIQYKWDFKCKC